MNCIGLHTSQGKRKNTHTWVLEVQVNLEVSPSALISKQVCLGLQIYLKIYFTTLEQQKTVIGG